MKMLKRIIILGVALILLSTIAACKSDDDDDWGNGSGSGKKDGISVAISEAGFGSQWLEEIGKAYYAQTGVKVSVTKIYVADELTTLAAAGTLPYDIGFALGEAYTAQAGGKLADLTPVYDAVPEGQTKTVRESTTPAIYDKLAADDGKIYQMNWNNAVASLVYNKTVLDKAFGANGYTLPRTTDELIAFCQACKNKNIYALSFSTGIPYASYAHLTWWAQYEGYDNYYDYYAGYYQKDGVRTLATGGEVMDMAGRARSLGVASAIFAKSNGYVHQYSDSMSFTEAQIAFLSQGFKGKDMKECAMNVNGDWLENEMASYLSVKPQDIRMMRLPVISAITEKLENTAMTDETLRALIDAIDGGAQSFGGVSQNDFDRVSEARRMVYCAALGHPAFIPVTSKNQDKAKDFLTFIASAQAQKIYAESLNGLTMPYGYTPAEETFSTFVKSRYELFGDDYLPIGADGSSPLVYRQAFRPYSEELDPLLYQGVAPAKILSDTKAYFMLNWAAIIGAAK